MLFSHNLIYFMTLVTITFIIRHNANHGHFSPIPRFFGVCVYRTVNVTALAGAGVGVSWCSVIVCDVLCVSGEYVVITGFIWLLGCSY